MGKVGSSGRKKPKRPFPWLLLLMFLASVYVFWILPMQLGPKKVQVDFEPAKESAAPAR